MAKLKGASDRKSKLAGKRIEGRKGNVVNRSETVLLAKKLHRANPKTGERRSLRQIAVELVTAGHLNERGKVFNHKSIKSMVEGPRPK